MIRFPQNELQAAPGEGKAGDELVVLAGQAERAQALKAIGLDLSGDNVDDTSHSTRYEYHSSYDYLSIKVPDFTDILGTQIHLEVFFTREKLALLCDNKRTTAALQEKMKTLDGACSTPEQVLNHLFYTILAGDAKYLMALEDEIAAMEETVVTRQPKNFTADMIYRRKILLVLKRYYEALFDLLEDLEENQNGFISKAMLRTFRLYTNRVDRLSNSVANLRDYLTQVREAYQNEIDINLNRTMQVFTVIATIFLPLTLIVGWYGMNLQMPEYDSPYAYAIIIAVCVGVVILNLWYFRKKKWF